ncbi:unnamed protein product [Clavelina lepadiformis]|uniref:Protein kinase domain-containing protein n=1 Tax=Clavelina lepadiformis TaxID=159417 RepID=A0ABP0H1U2_CLALP
MEGLPIFEAAEILTHPTNKGVVGYGSSGRIRYCRHKQLGECAVKCFAISGDAQLIEERKKKILAEAKILQNMTHKNIMQVHGVTSWSNSMGIITDFFKYGNLEDLLLKSNKLKDIPWPLRLRIAIEISQALSFLHNYKRSKALVHGDLKPQNILITDDLRAKLGDFGSVTLIAFTGASSMSTTVPSNTQHTPLYTAPEFLKDVCQTKRTTKMDVYSYGMILYELLTRLVVFHGATVHVHVVVSAIISQGQRPSSKYLDKVQETLEPGDREIFTTLKSIMERCWTENPCDRPQIDSVQDELKAIYKNDFERQLPQMVNQVLSEMEPIPVEHSDDESYVGLHCFSFPFEKITQSTDFKEDVAYTGRPKPKPVELPSTSIHARENDAIISESIFVISSDMKRYQHGQTEKIPYHLQKFQTSPPKLELLSSFYVDGKLGIMVAAGNKVFLLGPRVYCIDTDEENPKWTEKKSMNEPRMCLSAVVFKVILHNNFAYANSLLVSTESYDIAADTWTYESGMSGLRFDFPRMDDHADGMLWYSKKIKFHKPLEIDRKKRNSTFYKLGLMSNVSTVYEWTFNFSNRNESLQLTFEKHSEIHVFWFKNKIYFACPNTTEVKAYDTEESFWKGCQKIPMTDPTYPPCWSCIYKDKFYFFEM